ncbi:uncharacterized protein LOC110711891 [Chenopodium quinoa]|uniref:uncharacterized protein LOC110711891 n=1 Tax=Chenopodium quinoa TaxID=63459 RepID=UPI000B7782E0|nr:uncharacterized protein LOC110711891 [Chenopodium quinoa]
MSATSNTDDEITAITEQRLELTNAKTLESDLDFAFNLQLEEALTASLSLLPSTSSSSPLPLPEASSSNNNGDELKFADIQSEELEKLEQEHRDHEFCEIEAKKLRDDLNRRIHDQKLALEITRLPEDHWDEFGDEFERPFDEGSSSSSVASPIFRLYFKGLVEVEQVGNTEATLAGIGVAICDPRENLIFELSKPLVGNGKSRRITQIKALIEGLETARALDLKRIIIFCDNLPVYRYAMHAWQPKQRKVVNLMAKVEFLRKEFTYYRLCLVSRNVIKFAFKLARDAITSQISKPTEPNRLKILKETCVICLEETDQDKMFTIDSCLHKYCFSCMKQHVEAKLHNGMVPKCPHESCKYELNVSSCEKFLTPKLIEIMKQRVREASIPVAEKVYCPYPRCSVLMSRAEINDFARKENVNRRISGARKCLKCHELFCIYCRVPWHNNMSCLEYKRSNPNLQPEDAKLKSLATKNLWRQCVKCKHMIELAQGCYHMTCRCGFEFCYTCGAEWKNKKATCSCPLWNERNIMYDDSDFDDDDEEDYDEDEYYSESGSDSD